MAKKKVGIIGAGFGGLSAAIRLSNAGFEVTIFEKNDHAGGKASFIKEKGFRFDKGPSLLTMPFVVEQLFKDVGEDLSEFTKIHKLDNYCKYFWSDGAIINAYSDLSLFQEEIKKISHKDSRAVKDFLKYAKSIYDLTADIFLFKSFSEAKTFLNLKSLKTLFQIWKIDPFRSMNEAIKSFFENEKVIQLFNRYATYNGSNPYKAPATLNIIPHVEYNIGGYIPDKGIYSLVEAIYQLALKKNVQFNFNSDVKKIVVRNNKVSNLLFEQNGKSEEKEFDVIISNADVNFTYQNLLNGYNLKSAKRYLKLEASSSAMVFYWGISGTHNSLEVHNILFSDNYKNEFDEIFERKILPSDPTIYIYISSKLNNNDAPPNCENWFVMINTPNNCGQDWNKEELKIRKNIIDKIHRITGIDLKDKIIFERTLNPKIIEELTSSFRGSLYGISSNDRNAAFLRQQNRSKEIEGLYFCGGSAHPGGGIPLTILSGKITADLVIKHESK